jgi:hypothetical protein
MAKDGRVEAIIDASVLLNFLQIGRTDLLAEHPSYRFIVVDLVRNEVTKRGPATRLEAALQAGDLVPDGPPETIALEELATFAAMTSLKIGIGDKAVIAAAKVRGLVLAMDDKNAWRLGAALCEDIPREDTVSIMTTLIKAGVLDVAEADAIKADWEANHRFRVKFASFAEVI